MADEKKVHADVDVAADVEQTGTTTLTVDIERDTQILWEHDEDHAGVYRISREDRELRYAGPS